MGRVQIFFFSLNFQKFEVQASNFNVFFEDFIQ